MTPSPRIAAFIQGYEKCERRQSDGTFRAYLPTPNDVWTVGWGSTGPDIHEGTVWTQAQADERFAHDLGRFAAGVTTALDGCQTDQDQFDAIVSFSYNVGLGNLRSSTLLRKHLMRDYAAAAAEFPKWNKQAGKVLNGLTTRRAAEAAIYRGDA